MDAAFISTIPILMVAAIGPSLLQRHSPWSQRAYAILDEMSIRGNPSARLIRSELKQLDGELAQLLMKGNTGITLFTNPLCDPEKGSNPVGIVPPVAPGGCSQLELDFARIQLWSYLWAVDSIRYNPPLRNSSVRRSLGKTSDTAQTVRQFSRFSRFRRFRRFRAPTSASDLTTVALILLTHIQMK
ncbi:hypothetical protein PHISCL_06654 [Aspergillus sclerotialis]|uniref:Uncharacterized protein n=1 Tax=Aspergillus sclerotialis TaxID=2070753 RepID=A0A3A2ZCZ2_9EURO|nr:hypothetical protein PHISCL_06654 [Aspergillus sclerotialis]